MKMRKFAVVAALVTTALGVTAGGANAAPQQSAPEAVNFKAWSTPTASVVQTDAGSMAVENGVFKIKAADGKTVAGTELKFRVDDFEFPIAANIANHTATLTPQFDMGHAVYKPVDLPYQNTAPWKTPYDREQAAWNRMKDTISTGATVGTLVGGLTGGAIGCVLGGIAGATVSAAAIVGLFGAFLPAAVIGCFGGIIAVGALGTLAGQLLVTAPVAIAAAVQYFQTINAPFVPAGK
ncbi:hypothetical protein NRB20_08770 [Nocardia sp. RB20]|uniref:DUF8020 domain-containing protein n=2 Tax=Nocardia macrotermitis TaxID=2585198 RepID=A0A7K0CWC3_9NOCA|nr:hypothetical protein [Nocardia macrotermitis]MQY17810.1 hypothetical protein [Nocardia macrotermitis]